jgi:mycothiol synthase
VGYAMVWGREPHRRYTSFVVVHPRHLGEGIGTYLLGFIERRMTEHAADEEGAILWNWVDREDGAGRRMVEAAGFVGVRHHYTMVADLGGAVLDAPLPDGISVRTCDEADLKVIHSLDQETFAEHWGFTPTSYERWSQQTYERSDTDLSMWFLAFEGGEPAGFLIGRVTDDLGWIGDLGVRREHRRLGVASALLRHSFADFRRRGLRKVGLGVDASNESGAVRLYENVGMRAERGYITYEKLYRR